MNMYAFGLLIFFAVATFFMRNAWSWRTWAVYRYGATTLVTVYLILVFTRSYNNVTDRLEMDISEALPFIGAVLAGMLFGLLADALLRCYEHHVEEKPLRDFFKAHETTTRHRVDFTI